MESHVNQDHGNYAEGISLRIACASRESWGACSIDDEMPLDCGNVGMPQPNETQWQSEVECTCVHHRSRQGIEGFTNVSDKSRKGSPICMTSFDFLGNLPPNGCGTLFGSVTLQSWVGPFVQESQALLGSNGCPRSVGNRQHCDGAKLIWSGSPLFLLNCGDVTHQELFWPCPASFLMIVDLVDK